MRGVRCRNSEVIVWRWIKEVEDTGAIKPGASSGCVQGDRGAFGVMIEVDELCHIDEFRTSQDGIVDDVRVGLCEWSWCNGEEQASAFFVERVLGGVGSTLIRGLNGEHARGANGG